MERKSKRWIRIFLGLVASFCLFAPSGHADLTAGDVSQNAKADPADVQALRLSLDQFYQAESDGNQTAAAQFRDQIRRQLNSLLAKKVPLKLDNRRLTDDQFSAKLLSLQKKTPGSSQVAGTSFLKRTINMCVVLANLSCGVMTGDYDHPDLEPLEPEIVHSRAVTH